MTKYSHSSLCHAMLFCNQNMVVLLIHLALTKYYCCSNETMCWHFDKKAQEQIFEDNPVWFEISGMGVMGRFTRPLPLPAPLELPAPYPILPLPDWGLGQRTSGNSTQSSSNWLPRPSKSGCHTWRTGRTAQSKWNTFFPAFYLPWRKSVVSKRPIAWSIRCFGSGMA